jgi:DNA-directed RNA polymerase subunit RPC12/RpoP
MSDGYGRFEQTECDACGEEVEVARGEVIRCPMCGADVFGDTGIVRERPPKRPFYPPYSTGEKVGFLLLGLAIYAGFILFSFCAGAAGAG